jgi:WD40 repeat protein
LATTSEDKTVKLWDPVSGRLLLTLSADDGVLCGSFSPDGHILAAGSRTGTIWIWKTGGGVVRTLQSETNGVTNDGVYGISFSPDGKLLVSGSRNGTVKLWNVDSGIALQTWTWHKDRVSSVCFSPDGNVIASGSYDNSICVWNVHSSKLIWSTTLPEWVTAVKFSADGKILASGARDGIVRLWQTVNGLPLQTIQAIHAPKGGVYGLSFSPDGNMLAAGSDDNVIEFWTVEANSPLRQYHMPLRQYLDVYYFDGLELKPLPPANLYGGSEFIAQTQ